VDEIAVRIPDDHLGAVLGDLSSRRGRVLGTDVDPEVPGRTVVRAEVPASELLRYAVDLRAMTSGTALFTRHFSRYETVPEHARAHA
jgi:elongation factor G